MHFFSSTWYIFDVLAASFNNFYHQVYQKSENNIVIY